ncbi:MAG: flagellar basal-body MS-ring/collar protein FliF [Hyphomicrobiaceae bacterium]
MFSKLQIDQLVANLAKLGARKLAILAIVGLSVMLAVGLAAYYLGRPAMQPIYTGLSPQDVSRMTAALAEAGVPFDVNEQRTAVLVPFGRTARARSLLAEKGLPASGRAGYELFDQLGSMGLTSFMQEITRIRALEGEISRTIQALDGVVAARVHLVLSNPASFRSDRRDPSASVLIRTDGRFKSTVGETVRHIVASAVPGMKVEQVSVASTDGRLLASGGDEKQLGSLRLAEMERSMAAELEHRASRTLASTLGSGNFQISITARLDVDRQQVSETVFDPKSRIERSVRVVKQSGSSEDNATTAAIGVEANVPREEGKRTEGDKRSQREDRREELVNYELNKKVVETVREGYRIKRLAVAVVINRKQLAIQMGPRSTDAAAVEARMEEIKRLVSAATGASVERGDVIEVSAAEFGAVDGGLAPESAPGFTDYVLMNLGLIINAAAMLVVVLLVVMFGLRPLVGALANSESTPPRIGADVAGELTPPAGADGLSSSVALGFEGGSPELGPLPSGLAPQLSRPHGEAIRERLEMLVDADDVKVAKVLKTWMAEAG